jgi:hypothetical protein
MTRREWVGLVLVLLGTALLVGLAAPQAHAEAVAVPGIDLPNPIGGVGDAILDKICPPRQAPYPESPGDPVIKRGGGAGVYAQYGYGGLRWTTWDAGCLSWDKADTSMGTMLSGAANALDEFINEVQMAALDDSTTVSFDRVIERAVVGLRDAFWNPWSGAGLAVVGVLLVLYVLSGRESDALTSAASAALVLLAIFTLFSRPHLPADVGNAATSGIAQRVAGSLIAATPGGTMPASATPQEKFGEGYYQVSYQAWVDGWACGDTDAATRYGHRLLDAQAFSVQQYNTIRTNPSAADALIKGKAAAWTAIGEQMEKTNPVAFGCWKGTGQGRTSSAIKHAVVTLCAGFWVVLGSIALLALKWVLRLAVLFFVAFGALMLFWGRLRDRMMEFVLLGLLGPAFIAAGVGVLMWGYYVILLDPTTAWWQAGAYAFALGLAVWFGKGILQRIFVGMHEVSRGGGAVRAGGRKVRATAAHYGVGTWNGTSGASAAGGMAAAGAAGAAAAMVVAGHDDSRRRDDEVPTGQQPASPGRAEDDDRSPDSRRSADVVQQADDDGDAARQALVRAHTIAAARGDSPEGFTRRGHEGRWASPEPDVPPQPNYEVTADDHSDAARVPAEVVPTGDPEYPPVET